MKPCVGCGAMTPYLVTTAPYEASPCCGRFACERGVLAADESTPRADAACDRLTILASTIRALRKGVVEDERTAFDICDPIALERAAMTRARLEASLHEYFEVSERVRSGFGKSTSTPR